MTWQFTTGTNFVAATYDAKDAKYLHPTSAIVIQWFSRMRQEAPPLSVKSTTGITVGYPYDMDIFATRLIASDLLKPQDRIN